MYYKYGGNEYVGTMDGLTPAVMVGDPDLVKRIMIQDFDHFTDRRTINCSDQDEYMSEMLSMVNGDHWKNLR